MLIYFEEYIYPITTIQDAVDKHLYSTLNNGSSAKFQCVGYYFSAKIKDPIFILPKVFLIDGAKPFGLDCRPEEVITINDKKNPLRINGYNAFIYELSVWIYRAIDTFLNRKNDSSIIDLAEIQHTKSATGENSQTFLEIILQLLKFHKGHRYLFTYIAIINSSGNNKIHWAKTISKIRPIIRNNVPYYIEFKNKNKTINLDEELVVLFYSVLEYLNTKYTFRVKSDVNYPTLPSRKIESMLATGKGTRLLKKIRKKYFTDELVALWTLLYTFFEKAEMIESNRYHEEMLLARKFNLIFEDMIDVLIGDSNIPIGLKKQKDGKIVDHIYRDRALIGNSDVYFVGDSKYYQEGHDVGTNSVYKQFTYAKNIIQYALDNPMEGLKYRDNITEGYTITPNFFIRGYFNPENKSFTDCLFTPSSERTGRPDVKVCKHFDNRLFDRDTLWLKEYNINFLFVMSAYVLQNENKEIKAHIRSHFRTDLVATLNDKYNFYKVYPHGDIKIFIDKYFRQYIGKMYMDDEQASFVWLAIEKATKTTLIDEIKNEASIVSVTIET